MLLTGTLIALTANAPEDCLAAVTQSGAEILLGKELMIHHSVNLHQQRNIQWQLQPQNNRFHCKSILPKYVPFLLAQCCMAKNIMNT